MIFGPQLGDFENADENAIKANRVKLFGISFISFYFSLRFAAPIWVIGGNSGGGEIKKQIL